MVDLRDLTPAEAAAAALVLGRGMRDNPLHVAAFGPDPERREAALARMFLPLLERQMGIGAVLGAFSSGQIVGVCGMVPPGRCGLAWTEKLTLLPVILQGGGLSGAWNVFRWAADWSRSDSPSHHFHLGPVGVERDLQGQGIGSALLVEFCRRVDAARASAYLETDKGENVPFYHRHGFRVVDEHPVLRRKNWFMVRGVPASARQSPH
jgi:ribosomal protein S18 acetylase RimI-like enzyme